MLNSAARIVLSSLILAITSILFINSVSAQAQCDKVSTVNMTNLGSATANISYTAYAPDGTISFGPVSDTMAAAETTVYFSLPGIGDPGASVLAFPIATGVDGAVLGIVDGMTFIGSVIIQSDQELGIIANVICEDFSAGAAYNASAGASTSIYLPLLFKDNSGYYTQFTVQNISSSSTDVTVNYSDGTFLSPVTLAPGEVHVFNQNAESHRLPIFSGEVTSDGGPITAAVIMESTDIILAYTGFVQPGSIFPVFPLINVNNAGYITGIQIQNTGTLATEVTVTYTPSVVGTACSETQTIPPGDSNTFALQALSGDPAATVTDCAGGQRFIGSAWVTANSTSQPLIGLVNQLLPGVNGETYTGFSVDAATNEVAMPLIMDRNSGYFTGLNVMNVGSSATTVTCTFTDTSYQIVADLGPGEALTDIQQGKIADGYIGASVCTTSDPAGKIVAVVNELNQTASGDQLLVYEGIFR